MLRRAPLLLLEKPEDAFELQPVPAALIVDLEGTLVPFSPSPLLVIEAVGEFDEVARRNGFDVRRIQYITNADLKELTAKGTRISARIHSNAHKPFFMPPRQFGHHRRGGLIVGDQYLTDGLLAWRFGFSFGLVRSRWPQPVWPRLQLSVGRALSAAFFRPADQSG